MTADLPCSALHAEPVNEQIDQRGILQDESVPDSFVALHATGKKGPFFIDHRPTNLRPWDISGCLLTVKCFEIRGKRMC